MEEEAKGLLLVPAGAPTAKSDYSLSLCAAGIVGEDGNVTAEESGSGDIGSSESVMEQDEEEEEEASTLKLTVDKMAFYSMVARELRQDGLPAVANDLAEQCKLTESDFSDISYKQFHKLYKEEDKQKGSIVWRPLKLRAVPVLEKGEECLEMGDEQGTPPELRVAHTTRWMTKPNGACSCVSVSSASELVALGGDDFVVRLLEGTTGEIVGSYTKHTDRIAALTFHPRKPYCFSGSADMTINVFDLSKPHITEPAGSIREISGVTALSVHPCGDFLHVGTDDPVIRTYDLNTLSAYVYRTQHHKAGVTDLCCSSDGSILASASIDGSVHLYDVTCREPVVQIHDLHNGLGVCSVRWSRSQFYLLTSGLDGQTRIFDLRAGKQLIVMAACAERAVHYDAACSEFLRGEDIICSFTNRGTQQ
eukprot:GHVS01084723.1.p1 GENE.GHVS01084723.1~~GHVS01084723.1.p1  ORF type:complete len:421 (+),score=66.85 GHVS01084723.1:127-1389(+)